MRMRRPPPARPCRPRRRSTAGAPRGPRRCCRRCRPPSAAPSGAAARRSSAHCGSADGILRAHQQRLPAGEHPGIVVSGPGPLRRSPAVGSAARTGPAARGPTAGWPAIGRPSARGRNSRSTKWQRPGSRLGRQHRQSPAAASADQPLQRRRARGLGTSVAGRCAVGLRPASPGRRNRPSSAAPRQLGHRRVVAQALRARPRDRQCPAPRPASRCTGGESPRPRRR